MATTQAGLLLGDATPLAAAELTSVLAAFGYPAPTVSGRFFTALGSKEALQRVVGVPSFGELITIGSGAVDITGIANEVFPQLRGKSLALRSTRLGPKNPTGISPSQIANELGRALENLGAKIDLGSADEEIHVYVEMDNHVLFLRPTSRPKNEFVSRQTKDRDHFSPITLAPRRAASLVNLASVPVGGVIYDPCCGTGGILLEGAMMGFTALGSDIDPLMVAGSYQTLTDAENGPFTAIAFVADAGASFELLPAAVDGIVTDLPYGRSSSTKHEPVSELYPRLLQNFANILAPGRKAVIGLANPSALGDVESYGFKVESHFEEYVHKTMTRHFLVLRREP